MGTVRVVWQLGEDDPAAADRLLAGEVTDVLGRASGAVRIGRRCPHCGSARHGRPVVLTEPDEDPPFLSVSRTSGIVVVAVSTHSPVGVDIERADQAWPAGSTDALLHPRERPRDDAGLTALWVRKESLLKATGDGLRVEPSVLRLDDAGGEPRLLEWPGGPVDARIYDLHLDGYLACVAVVGDPAPEVTLRQAGQEAASRRATPRTGHSGPARSVPLRAR